MNIYSFDHLLIFLPTDTVENILKLVLKRRKKTLFMSWRKSPIKEVNDQPLWPKSMKSKKKIFFEFIFVIFAQSFWLEMTHCAKQHQMHAALWQLIWSYVCFFMSMAKVLCLVVCDRKLFAWLGPHRKRGKNHAEELREKSKRRVWLRKEKHKNSNTIYYNFVVV